MSRNRSEFSDATKAERKAYAGNRCEACETDLAGKKAEYDHLIPDRLGGKPTFANCRVLCETCHAKKTGTEDIPRIAKMKRQAIASAGVKTAPAKPLQGPAFQKSSKTRRERHPEQTGMTEIQRRYGL